jgi:hypothetical protein
MDFVKRNMFFILCAVGAIAGIALGVTGLQAMPKVVTTMKDAGTIYANLEGLQSKPINEKTIETEKERIETVKADRAKILDKARGYYPDYFKDGTGTGAEGACKLNTLVDGVLPEGSSDQRVKFRAAYQQAMKDLIGKLSGGGPSSTVEQDLMRRKIEDEKAELANDSTLAAEFTGETRNAAGGHTRAGVRQDARVRADQQAAQRISCYVTGSIPEKERKAEYQPTFQFEVAMENIDSAEAPADEEVWRAQVGYWIQRDVVEAIADINNAAAEQLMATGQERWVGNMPVKDVISIRLSPDFYVPPEGQLYPPPEPGGYAPAVPTGTAETVFTKTASGPYYEVVQLSVKLVMDQRDILKLVERISSRRFYTLLRAAYKEVPPNLALNGKIYGSEPAVNVVLDFEFVMLGGLFRECMPTAVCEKFAWITCPEREGDKDDK